MKKHDKRQQNLFSEEDYIEERIRAVRASRLKNETQKAGNKAAQKPKGTNAKNGNIPRM